MKKATVQALTRVQIAMWVDGEAHCAVCKRVYESVDDFLARNPRAGGGWQTRDEADRFVDDACYPKYGGGS